MKGDNFNYTPLHWAIYHGDFLLANLVFDEDPTQIFVTNKEKNIPFDMALVNDDESKVVIVAEIIVKELMKKFFKLYKEVGSDFKNIGNKEFLKALREASRRKQSKRKRKSLEMKKGIFNNP